jgi:hypothetical protein
MKNIIENGAQNVHESVPQLKSVVLKDIEKKIRRSTLTEKQLQILQDRVNSLSYHDKVDKLFLKELSINGPVGLYKNATLMKVGGSSVDVGAIDRESFGTTRPTLDELIESSFEQAHKETLESERERHDDGVTIEDLGITPNELIGVIEKIKKEVVEFRKNDTQYEYDQRVIETWLCDLNEYTFDCFSKHFLNYYETHKEELLDKKVGVYDKLQFAEISNDSVQNMTVEMNKDDAQKVFSALIADFSPDVLEMSYGQIYDLVKREGDRRLATK